MGRRRILNCRYGFNIMLYYVFFSFLSLKKPEALNKHKTIIPSKDNQTQEFKSKDKSMIKLLTFHILKCSHLALVKIDVIIVIIKP